MTHVVLWGYDDNVGRPSGVKGLRSKATKMVNRQSDSGATTGYGDELWAVADALRVSMDAGEYKHVLLGLIF